MSQSHLLEISFGTVKFVELLTVQLYPIYSNSFMLKRLQRNDAEVNKKYAITSRLLKIFLSINKQTSKQTNLRNNF